MKAILMILAGLMMSAPALADPQTPRVDAREYRQAQRITDGVRSGELTGPEVHRLIHQQIDIVRTEDAFKSDGTVTPGERLRLQQKQDHASRAIFRQKHDRQRRRG